MNCSRVYSVQLNFWLWNWIKMDSMVDIYPKWPRVNRDIFGSIFKFLWSGWKTLKSCGPNEEFFILLAAFLPLRSTPNKIGIEFLTDSHTHRTADTDTFVLLHAYRRIRQADSWYVNVKLYYSCATAVADTFWLEFQPMWWFHRNALRYAGWWMI